LLNTAHLGAGIADNILRAMRGEWRGPESSRSREAAQFGRVTMHNSSAITRATSLDRVQPKSPSTADRRSDSRVVRHALGRLRSVQLAGVIAPSARIDAPFICG
jgi:hypothetical protein